MNDALPEEGGEASAPSAGPAPWHLYRPTLHTAARVASVEPPDATRWDFAHSPRLAVGSTVQRGDWCTAQNSRNRTSGLGRRVSRGYGFGEP